MRLLARTIAERGLLCAAGAQKGRRRRWLVRCRARRRPDQGSRRAEIPQAAARGQEHPQNRAEHEIRLAGVCPARHRDRRLRRHHADFLCAGRRQRRARHGRPVGKVARPQNHPLRRRRRLGQIKGELRLRRHRQGDRLRRRGRRRDAAAVERAQSRGCRPSMSRPSTKRWSARCRRCWRAWSGAAFPSTGKCSRACPANSPRSRARWRTRSSSSPASRSIPARPSSSATFCSARWVFPAVPRPKPGSGRPARANWKSSPNKATRCRARFSTGGRCPSCARPIPRRCRLTSTRRPTACTRLTRSPRPRPAGCRRRSRICRTSRCAPRKAARSGAPSSPIPA